jgi:hypothetical protein
VVIARAVALLLALGAGAAQAQELAGAGRISVLAGWRLTPNDHFYGNAVQLGYPPLSDSLGGPILTGAFAYVITEQLELGIDLFVGAEQLELDGLGVITTVSYGGLLGMRLQFPLSFAGQSSGLIPYLGVHTGPALVFVTDEVKGGVETLTQAWAGSAGLTLRFDPTWALTLEYKLMLLRGYLPEVGTVNGGGSWFGAAVTYYLPGEGPSGSSARERW